MKSIRQKLMLTICLVLILGIGALSVLNYIQSSQIFTVKIVEAHKTVAEAAAKMAGLWFDERRSYFRVLSDLPAVKNGQRDAAMSAMLSVIKVASPDIESVFLADTSGHYFDTLGKAGEFEVADFFERVLTTQNVAISKAFISSSGKTAITMGFPVMENKQVIGVVGGVLPVEKLAKRIGDVDLGVTGYAYVVEEGGMIVFHPKKEVAMKQNALQDITDDPKFIEAIKDVGKKESGVIQYSVGEIQYSSAYFAVPKTRLTVFTAAPADKLMFETRTIGVVMAGAGSLVLLLLVLILGEKNG
ncbi:MAG TPA: cache domain-containing protein [Patescibacteria group bacterium]|nr:cache domain-containing protein [Patescibacteria group bacterium]